MFPGDAHEMTNVYHMDGGSMLLTHYCAVGNQPRMRAEGAAGERHRVQVRRRDQQDLGDQACMGEMTIEFKDSDHIVERWRTIGGDKEHATVFELARRR